MDDDPVNNSRTDNPSKVLKHPDLVFSRTMRRRKKTWTGSHEKPKPTNYHNNNDDDDDDEFYKIN